MFFFENLEISEIQELDTAEKRGTLNEVTLQTLERKKMQEKQLRKILGMLSTIANQKYTLEHSKLNATVLQSMSTSGNALKKAQKYNKFTEVICAQI